jgi:hypothetical protein
MMYVLLFLASAWPDVYFSCLLAQWAAPQVNVVWGVFGGFLNVIALALHTG